MPFDGSGTFSRIHNWQEDRDAGIRILADRHDAEDDNFATAFNQTFLRTGTVPMTGNLMMNGNNIMGIKAGTVVSPSLTWELDIGTGFYQPAPKQLALAINGVQRVLWKETGGDFAGNMNVTGDITGQNLGLLGGATIEGGLTVNGAVNFGGTLNMAGMVRAPRFTATTDDGFRLAGVGAYMSFYNNDETVRYGFIQHNATNIIIANEVGAGKVQVNNSFGINGTPVTDLHVRNASTWPIMRLEKASVGYWDVSAGQGGGGGNSFTLNVNSGPALFEVNTDGNTKVAGTFNAIGDVSSNAAGSFARVDIRNGGELRLYNSDNSNAGNIKTTGASGGASTEIMDGNGGKTYFAGTRVGVGRYPTTRTLEVQGNIGAHGAAAEVAWQERGGANEWGVYSEAGHMRFHRNGTNLMTMNANGDVTARDIIAARGPNSGAVFFGNDMTRYLYFDTVKLSITGMSVYVTTGALQCGPGVTFLASNDVWHGSGGDGANRFYFAINNSTYFQVPTNIGVAYYFRRQDNAVVMQINSDGMVVATNFTATSDRRLKDNIKPISGALGKLLKVYGHTFSYKNSGNPGAGVMAQDLQSVLPELVHTDEEGMLSVNYNGLVAYLLEAVRDLQNSINSNAMAASYK